MRAEQLQRLNACYFLLNVVKVNDKKVVMVEFELKRAIACYFLLNVVYTPAIACLIA